MVRITVGRSFVRPLLASSSSSASCDGRRGVDGLRPIGDHGTSLMRRAGGCVRGEGCGFVVSLCSAWSFSFARRAAIPPPDEVSISDMGPIAEDSPISFQPLFFSPSRVYEHCTIYSSAASAMASIDLGGGGNCLC